MKNLASFQLVMTFALVALLSMSFTNISIDVKPPRWEHLGTKMVNYKLDRDVIRVSAKDGLFTKIKLKAKGGAVNMRKVTIHFSNGQTQSVNIRKNIPAGGASRVIDIQGGKRAIQKVVFWYDTKNRSRRRAKVILLGRH